MDEKPTEDYSDIGGLDKQIQELVEAVVLPVTHKEGFKTLASNHPRGVLLYGPPGTGVMPSYQNPVVHTKHGCLSRTIIMRRSGNASLHHSPYRSLAPLLVHCNGIHQLYDLSCHHNYNFYCL